MLEILNMKDLQELYIRLGQDLTSPELVLYYLGTGQASDEAKRREAGPSLAYEHNLIHVSGLDKAIFKFARCCNPLPGQDDVVAILSERGITFHNRNCQDLHQRHALQPQQLLDVKWNTQAVWRHSLSFSINIVDQNLRDLLPNLSNLPPDIRIQHISSGIDRHNQEMVSLNVVLRSFEEAAQFFSLLPAERTVVDEFAREGGPRNLQPAACGIMV